MSSIMHNSEQSDAIEKALRDRIEALEAELAEILCVIHRDGGHYINENGLEKAYKDAFDVLYSWRSTFDELAALKSELAEAKSDLTVARSQRDTFELGFAALKAQAQEREGLCDDLVEHLIGEVLSIDCRYRGDPSYDHDAYWMREEVLKLLKKQKPLFTAPPPNAEDAKLLQQCRSSVAFDLREMERLILRKGEACNQCDHDEANRLLKLLEAIDARGEGK